jgi:sec-independent protein translocase protein TatB
MEILGIGPTELVFILLIAIIVLGPNEMQKAGRTVGRWLNQLRTSEGWKIVRDTSRELSNLPNKWMREANLEMWETQQDLRRAIDPRAETAASPPRRNPIPSDAPQPASQSEPPVETPMPPSEENPANPSDKHD